MLWNFAVAGCSAQEADAIVRLLTESFEDLSPLIRKELALHLAGLPSLLKLFWDPLQILQVAPTSLNAKRASKFSCETPFTVWWSDHRQEHSRYGEVGPRVRPDTLILDAAMQVASNDCVGK